MGNGGDHQNLAAAWGGERGSRKTREMGSNVGVCAWVGRGCVCIVGGARGCVGCGWVCAKSSIHVRVMRFFVAVCRGRGRPLDTLGYFICRLLLDSLS